MDTFIRSERRTRKAAALYEAALDVFAELGFREAGIEDIARRAGVANGTIYIYATSKRDLYRLAVEYGLGQWQAASAAAALAVGGEARLARPRFEALCRAAFCYLESEPRLRRILSRDPSLFPATTGRSHGEDPFQDINRRSVGMLERAIVDGIESGEFQVDDPAAAAELLFSLYRILIESAYVRDNVDERRRFEAGLAIIVNGISKR